MEKSLALPIFIAEGHDVMVFRDVATAEMKLEDVDVDDGVYEGWDAEGRMLQLRTVPAYGRMGARAVRITPEDSGAANPDALRDRLATILDTHAGRQTAGRPLAEVVTVFVEWASYTS